MPISNPELAQKLDDAATFFRFHAVENLNWLTSESAQVTITDPITGNPITVKTLFQINADYAAIIDPVNGVAQDIENDRVAAEAAAASATASASAASTSAAESATSAAGAAASATAATLSEANAANSETAATGSATAASVSESNAAVSATAAATSETNAASSASAAAADAAAASGHNAAAAGSALEAEKWAGEAVDVEVEPGLYSARHWAQKANDTVYGAVPGVDGSLVFNRGGLFQAVDDFVYSEDLQATYEDRTLQLGSLTLQSHVRLSAPGTPTYVSLIADIDGTPYDLKFDDTWGLSLNGRAMAAAWMYDSSDLNSVPITERFVWGSTGTINAPVAASENYVLHLGGPVSNKSAQLCVNGKGNGGLYYRLNPTGSSWGAWAQLAEVSDLGELAYEDWAALDASYATAAQGALADSAAQPGAANTWTAAQDFGGGVGSTMTGNNLTDLVSTDSGAVQLRFKTDNASNRRFLATNAAGSVKSQLQFSDSQILFYGVAVGEKLADLQTTRSAFPGRVEVGGDAVNIALEKTPASATAAGTKGDMCWDSNYVYVCVATNTWKRSALSTW